MLPTMSGHYICFLLLAVFTVFTQSATPYKTCDAQLGTASDVRVSGCSATPCILVKGGTITIEVDFTTNSDVQTVKDSVYGFIGGIRIPFFIANPDACTGKGLTCPLKKGQKYTYKSTIPISKDYPSIRLIVEWSIKDENTKQAFCVMIPAQLQ